MYIHPFFSLFDQKLFFFFSSALKLFVLRHEFLSNTQPSLVYVLLSQCLYLEFPKIFSSLVHDERNELEMCLLVALVDEFKIVESPPPPPPVSTVQIAF